MGSSGNGMFGTYRGGGAGSIVRGGNNGGDECPLAIENILLEDVAISEYSTIYSPYSSRYQNIFRIIKMCLPLDKQLNYQCS